MNNYLFKFLNHRILEGIDAKYINIQQEFNSINFMK